MAIIVPQDSTWVYKSFYHLPLLSILSDVWCFNGLLFKADIVFPFKADIPGVCFLTGIFDGVVTAPLPLPDELLPAVGGLLLCSFLLVK